MRALLAVLAVLLLLLGIGLRVRPRPFPAIPETTGATRTVPLPDDLPVPVARFYRALYGDEVPVADTAVVSGRATMRIAGVPFPARFRFTHEAGRAYRHDIELALFGLPIMRVDERYVDGRARMELPFGVTEDEPRVDAAANQGLWAEAVWFPGIFLADDRVRWEPVDDATAVLVVPHGEEEQRFVARFDEADGRLRLLETMRWKEATDDARTLWIVEARAWGRVDDREVPVDAALLWLGDRRPWAEFEIEEVAWGVDAAATLRDGAP